MRGGHRVARKDERAGKSGGMGDAHGMCGFGAASRTGSGEAAQS